MKVTGPPGNPLKIGDVVTVLRETCGDDGNLVDLHLGPGLGDVGVVVWTIDLPPGPSAEDIEKGSPDVYGQWCMPYWHNTKVLFKYSHDGKTKLGRKQYFGFHHTYLFKLNSNLKMLQTDPRYKPNVNRSEATKAAKRRKAQMVADITGGFEPGQGPTLEQLARAERARKGWDDKKQNTAEALELGAHEARMKEAAKEYDEEQERLAQQDPDGEQRKKPLP